MTNILTNDLVYISIISGIVYLTTAYYIKFKFFNSQNINTSNTPNSPELNFTQQQYTEINDFMDQGGVLNQETRERIDEDVQTIMGPEHYNDFQHDLQLIENDFNQELLRIFSEEISRL